MLVRVRIPPTLLTKSSLQENASTLTMTAEIKGGNLIITMPLDKKGKSPKTKPGKEPSTNLIHASSAGFQETQAKVNDLPLYINVLAISKP